MSSISVVGPRNSTRQTDASFLSFFLAEKTFSPRSKNQEYKRKSQFDSEEKTETNRSAPEAFLQTPALDKPVIKVWFTGTSAAVWASRLQMRRGSRRLWICDSGLRLVVGTKNTQLGRAKHRVWKRIYKVNYCICADENIACCWELLIFSLTPEFQSEVPSMFQGLTGFGWLVLLEILQIFLRLFFFFL